jgi:anti-anti-sigma factor
MEGAGTLSIQALDGRRGLRLAGEVDLRCRGMLEQALEAALAGDGDVHLDLAGVRFIDVGGATLFVRAASRLDGDRRLVLHQPSDSLRRMIELLWGAVPGVVLDRS